MIVVQLLGGMGNQMFQYALGRTLSIKHNTELILDTSFLGESSFNHTPRIFALDKFHIKATISEEKFKTVQKRTKLNELQSLLDGQIRLHQIRESSFNFDKQIIESEDNCYLEGYWQSFKYFESVSAQIMSDFAFSIDLNEQTGIFLDKINSSTSVSMHVRRGDYVNNPVTSSYHGYCGIDYYNTAITAIRKEYPEAVFFVFSDDPLWAKQNFQSDATFYYASDLLDSSSHLDFMLMSACKHSIIANSSFSWWGAWLNPNPEKLIIAPAKWFNDSTINTSDLIPSEWLRL